MTGRDAGNGTCVGSRFKAHLVMQALGHHQNIQLACACRLQPVWQKQDTVLDNISRKAFLEKLFSVDIMRETDCKANWIVSVVWVHAGIH